MGCHISGQAMKLMIVLAFCLGFVACIPGPRDQVIINVESRPAPMSKSSDLAAPEEPSASNEITPEMAEKLNELFHTGSNLIKIQCLNQIRVDKFFVRF